MIHGFYDLQDEADCAAYWERFTKAEEALKALGPTRFSTMDPRFNLVDHEVYEGHPIVGTRVRVMEYFAEVHPRAKKP